MVAKKDSLKEIKFTKLETLLLEQHYSERIIKAGINKASKIPQNELRTKEDLTFCFKLDPNNYKALPIIKQTL